MGTYNKGILGSFSGKVGPVVGATWRGKEVMRSLPKKSNRAATELQAVQRLKFTTATDFLNSLSPIISKYYGSNTGLKTRMNAAMGYTMKEAMTYVTPNFNFIYNKVQISKGDLIGLEGATADPSGGTTIDLAWEDNSGQGMAKDTDKLIIAVYEPISKAVIYNLDVAGRSETGINFPLPSYLAGLTVQVWGTFASIDDKLFATSVYMGSVVLT